MCRWFGRLCFSDSEVASSNNRASFLSVTNCYASGDVTGGWRVQAGGLIGRSSNPSYSARLSPASLSVTSCYALGKVTIDDGKTGSDVGGLIGSLYGGTFVTSSFTINITNCYASGDVAGAKEDAYVGGLIGRTRSDAQLSVSCQHQLKIDPLFV